MEEKETTLDLPALPALPKMEISSPPSHCDEDDDDETEGDGSDGEEGVGGVGAGAGAGRGGGAPPLKKGPWTPDEDKRLRAYVEAHGHGNWNQVQKNAGLNRCGKSCRLRWANHLRPDLKKGPFDKEEEQKIIELHAMMGNKWAKMAHFLPGRTDNEIKNFWNTRSKRLSKAGLGLYPDGLLSRVANQDMGCQSPDDSHGKKRPNELSRGSGLEYDDIVFEKLDYKKQSDNLLAPNFVFPNSVIPNSLPIDAMNPLKRHASSGSIISDYSGSLACEQFPDELEKACYSTDFNPGITNNHSVPFGSAPASGPPVLNGNFSTSETIQRSMMLELPSFQCPSFDLRNSSSHSWLYECPPEASPIGQADTFIPSPAAISLKSECSSHSWLYECPPASPIGQADTFIPSPAAILLKSECFSSQNTGLLDALVQEGHGLGDPTKSQESFEVLVPSVPYAYPLSSSPSLFGDNLLKSSSLDEFQTPKSPGLDASFVGSKHHGDSIFPDKYLLPCPDLPWRSDASLEVSFLDNESPHSKYQPINYSLDGILYRDSCDEARLSAAGGHQLGLEAYPWKSMPGACHMSESPESPNL